MKIRSTSKNEHFGPSSSRLGSLCTDPSIANRCPNRALSKELLGLGYLLLVREISCRWDEFGSESAVLGHCPHSCTMGHGLGSFGFMEVG